MKIDKATSEQIQELQMLEQNLQSLALQSQAFQLEINEAEHALEELKKTSSDEVFKIIGQVMISSDKKSTEEELKKKLDILNIRIKSISKQESEISKKTEELKKEVTKKLNSQN